MKAPITLTRATCGPPGPGFAARVLRAVAHAALLVIFMRRISRAIAQFEALLDLWRTAGPQIPKPAVRDGLQPPKADQHHHLAAGRAEPATPARASAPSAAQPDRLAPPINNIAPAASARHRPSSSPHGPASRAPQNHPNLPLHPQRTPRAMPFLPPMRSFDEPNRPGGTAP